MLKAEAINQAYAQIRISGLTTEQVPEETTIALRVLDQMMAQWRVMGRDVGYNFPPPNTDGNLTQSDPGETFGVADWAVGGSIANMAKQLVSYFGKDVPPVLAGDARFGLTVIKQQTFKSDDVPYPHRMPIGSGNRLRSVGYLARFYYPKYKGRHQTQEIKETQNLDLSYDFTPHLVGDDFIASYTIEADPAGGVSLVSDSQVDNAIFYRVLAYRNRDGRIDLTATSEAGLVFPMTFCFETVNDACVVTQGAQQIA